VPTYRIVNVEGEAHAQTFTAECAIASLAIATLGRGTSRRVAEQAAAEAAWRAVTANSTPA
jgi:ribonuclease-3